MKFIKKIENLPENHILLPSNALRDGLDQIIWGKNDVNGIFTRKEKNLGGGTLKTNDSPLFESV